MTFCTQTNRKATYTVPRVTQEERSISWDVTIRVIVRKAVHMNVRQILSGHRDRAVTVCCL